MLKFLVTLRTGKELPRFFPSELLGLVEFLSRDGSCALEVAEPASLDANLAPRDIQIFGIQCFTSSPRGVTLQENTKGVYLQASEVIAKPTYSFPGEIFLGGFL